MTGDPFDRWAAEQADRDVGRDKSRGSTIFDDVRETAAGGAGILDDLRLAARRALQLSRRLWRP